MRRQAVFGDVVEEFALDLKRPAGELNLDRAMLAELALLGRFKSVPHRLFLKRFHAGVSWALDQKELKGFLSTDGKAYSRRARQIHAYFNVPAGKPVAVTTKSACTALVAVHCVKTAMQALARKDAHSAAHGNVWRRRLDPSGPSAVRRSLINAPWTDEGSRRHTRRQ